MKNMSNLIEFTELDISAVEHLNLNWTKQLWGNNVNSSKQWFVLKAKDEEYVYYRPVEKVKQLEFETLFNFQMSCKDFNKNKVVRYKIK